MPNVVWHIGRKRVVAYLRPYLELSADFSLAWRKVKRWKDRYGLPLLYQPNGTPYLDAEEFHLWWGLYLEKSKEIEAKRN